MKCLGILRYIQWGFLALALVGVVACSQPQSTLPAIEIALPKVEDGQDSIIALYWGDEARHTDTLLASSSPLLLYPDTTQFHSVLVSLGADSLLGYYMYEDGQWQARLAARGDSLERTETWVDFSGVDVSGKSHTLGTLRRGRWLLLSFGTPRSLHTLTRGQWQELRKRYGKDSIRFIYMLPTPSDSVARSALRRDSIEGIAFSDSLGQVSRMRQLYRIADSPEVELFFMDSLGQLLPSPLSNP